MFENVVLENSRNRGTRRKKVALSNLDTAKRVYELVNSDPTKLPEVLDVDIQWEIVEGFPYGGKYNGLKSAFEDSFWKTYAKF